MASYDAHRTVGKWFGLAYVLGCQVLFYMRGVREKVSLATVSMVLFFVGSTIPDLEAGARSKPNEMIFVVLSITAALFTQSMAVDVLRMTDGFGILSLLAVVIIMINSPLAFFGRKLEKKGSLKKSKPRTVTFHILTVAIAAGCVVLDQYLFASKGISIIEIPAELMGSIFAILAASMFFVVDGPLRKLFDKITDHREAWHSTPAAILAFLIMFQALKGMVLVTFEFDVLILLVMSASFGFGFYAHLLTDLVNSLIPSQSSVTHDGNVYDPKNSLGSEVDFAFPFVYRKVKGKFRFQFEGKRVIGFLIMYIGMGVLVYFNWDLFYSIFSVQTNLIVLASIAAALLIIRFIVGMMHGADIRRENKERNND